jgi:phosphoglycolate phosphatase
MLDLRELADPGRVLLWDLDGTIVDTSEDITAGVAGALHDLGARPLSKPEVIANVGRGAEELMTRCLAAVGRPPADGEDLARAVGLFRQHYALHLMDATRPYGDLDQVLLELTARGRRMAVISNKPADFTREILDRLGLLPCFRVVLGGDSLPARKPSPEPFLHALAQWNPAVLPGAAAAIGDSMIDVETARAAGVPICGVAWGFDPDGLMRAAELDWRMEEPSDLARALLGSSP